RANRTVAKLQDEVAEILRQAAEADQAEDRQHGPTRGDELPAELASPTARLARLQQAKARLDAEAAERQRRYQQRVADLAAATREVAGRLRLLVDRQPYLHPRRARSLHPAGQARSPGQAPQGRQAV